MSETATATVTGPQGQSSAPSPLSSGVVAPAPRLPRPWATSWPDERVQRVRGVAPTEEQKDRPTRRDHRRGRAWEMGQLLRDTFGTVVRDTTRLQLTDGTVIDEHRDLGGRIVRWSLWAPRGRVLIDRPRVIPAEEEIVRRKAFADANGLRYALVTHQKLTLREIRNWLDDEGGNDGQR